MRVYDLAYGFSARFLAKLLINDRTLLLSTTSQTFRRPSLVTRRHYRKNSRQDLIDKRRRKSVQNRAFAARIASAKKIRQFNFFSAKNKQENDDSESRIILGV